NRATCPEELSTRKHEEKEDMTMQTRRTDYDIVLFPALQHQFGAAFELAHRQHTMYALIEVDVTQARQDIHAYRARTGAPLSLTAFLIACLARAIDADKAMQAYRLGRRQLVLFADVDVANVVERDVEGQRLPVWHIIRAANRKSLEAIQQEIREAQDDKNPQTLTGRPLPRWLQAAFVRGQS